MIANYRYPFHFHFYSALIPWALWLAAAYLNHQLGAEEYAGHIGALGLAGLCGPLFVIACYISKDRVLLGDVARRFLDVRRGMKRYLLASLLLMPAIIILMATANTSRAETGQGGLFGDIRLGGGIISGRPSGLDVLDDNDRLDDLDSRGSRRSQGLILLGAELGYTFKKTGSTLLAAMDSEGLFSLSLRQEAGGVGELTLSALYEKKDVWKNPYLVGINRSRTDAESLGLVISWENILGTGTWLVFEQMHTDIEDDLIGQIEPELRRDGRDTTLGLGYTWDLAAGGVLVSSLSHIWLDRDGAANSGSGYVAELKHVLGVGRLTIATSLEWKHTGYDDDHPIFHQKRKETDYGISEMISLAEPFGLKNWSLFVIAAVGKSDSNITFFDSSHLLSGAGIGYKF